MVIDSIFDFGSLVKIISCGISNGDLGNFLEVPITLPYGRALSKRKLKKARYISARHHNSDIPAWVDGALEKATQINPKQRYEMMSEFIADISKPNPTLIKESQPLLQKNPLGFWRFVAIASLLLNLVLLYIQTQR